MKLVYYSSVLNHHQKSLCDEFYALLGDEFCFVQTMPMEQQRVDLGYQQEQAPYVIHTYASEQARQQAEQLAVEADVMLAGVFPVKLLYERMRRNKLTFRHTETYFKDGVYKLFRPNALRIAWMEHTRYRKKPLYLLCASALAAGEVSIFGAYPGKKLKWGYFPPVERRDEVHAGRRDNQKILFLWAGRMLDWKKPMYAIETVRYLHEKGYPVHLNMLGTGPLLDSLKEYVQEHRLSELVTLCGPLPPTQVREHMNRADAFFFTSTRREGWGAVLNEAMNSGCAVLASREAGSTGYLVRHGENGLVYEHNDLCQLKQLAEMLCKDKGEVRRLGANAAVTITELWNYELAAKRFVALSQSLLTQGEAIRYEEGPLSRG